MSEPDYIALEATREAYQKGFEDGRMLGAIDCLLMVTRADWLPDACDLDGLSAEGSIEAVRLQALQVLNAVERGSELIISGPSGDVTVPREPRWKFCITERGEKQ